MSSISESVKRFDFEDKVTGTAKYSADLDLPGLIYAKTLRSIQPRALIKEINLPEMPEGYVIIDHTDIPQRNIVPIVLEDEPFLAEGIVNFIGQPILLVVGPDRNVLNTIIEQISVRYEPLKPILSIEEAMETNHDFIYGEKPYFVEYSYQKGDFEQAIQSSVRIIEDEFRTGYQEQAYLEPQSFVGDYRNDTITVYGSMQCPYYITDALKMALGWDESRIRVVQLPTGGAFGGKEDYPSIPGVHAALASIKTGKPVQLVFDRKEDIIATTKRHPSIIRLKSYLDENGKIIAREADVMEDAGAYAGLSSVVLQRSVFAACGVYNIEHLKVRGRTYATNNVVTGAFRGFGGPQSFFAIEMHMENIALRLGVDSLELKRKYLVKKGDTSSTGGRFNYDIKLDEMIDRIDSLSGYTRKRKSLGTLKGIGCSIFYHGCGFTGSSEADMLKSKVRLRKNKDSTVEIFVSNTEIGQGVLTTLSKIVAKTLDIPLERVRQDYPDTKECPNSGPTVASRTLMIVGKMLEEAAKAMKERWSEESFEIIQAYQYPDNLTWDNKKLQGNAYPEYSWGVNVVEVDINPLTYQVKVEGLWAIYDIGNPIDEKIVQGQVEGGFMQGLGYASMELLQAKNGKLMQDTFSTYMIPSATDFPRLQFELMDNPFPNGPFGARGLGELPVVGVAPAYASAIQNAIGHPITQIPVMPEILMELVEHGH